MGQSAADPRSRSGDEHDLAAEISLAQRRLNGGEFIVGAVGYNKLTTGATK